MPCKYLGGYADKETHQKGHTHPFWGKPEGIAGQRERKKVVPVPKLTLGSLFDGLGGWLIAAVHAGVKPIWASEIGKFPCAVTAHHFPDVAQLGDIRGIDGARIEPVDIVTAGSPCQDLSIAGRQEGLKGARSGLFLRAVDIVRSMRRATRGQYPRFFVWENVPGVFSSNKGADFRAVLEEIAEAEIPMPDGKKWADAGLVECDVCQIAWRCLDSQYWGVPQRRKRIFLVADFGTAQRCAGEILFEPKGLHGDSSAGREAGEAAAPGAKGGVGAAGGGCYVPRVARSLTARADGSPCIDRGPEIIAVEAAPTLSAMDSGNKPAVLVYENHGQDSRIKGPLDKSPAINAQAGTGGNNLPLVQHGIAYGIGRDPFNQGKNAQFGMTINEEMQPPLVAKGAGAVMSYQTVRRLTPTECERLQGLPDGYTLIADKSCSDSARYKALGNGMAQPCADWVMRRIADVART